MKNLNELIDAVKVGELLGGKKAPEENKTAKKIVTVLAIIGAVAAVAGIAYAVYKYLTPSFLDDFDDDFDDDFEDDFFEEEEPIEIKPEA